MCILPISLVCHTHKPSPFIATAFCIYSLPDLVYAFTQTHLHYYIDNIYRMDAMTLVCPQICEPNLCMNTQLKYNHIDAVCKMLLVPSRNILCISSKDNI